MFQLTVSDAGGGGKGEGQSYMLLYSVAGGLGNASVSTILGGGGGGVVGEVSWLCCPCD